MRNIKTKGMTLIEVLLASCFAAILMMSLASVTGTMMDSFTVGKGECENHRSVALSLDTIAKFVRKAKSASLSNIRTLVLTSPQGVETTFAWSGISGDPLTIKNAAASPLPLMNNIKNVIFKIHTRNTVTETESVSIGNNISFDNFAAEDWFRFDLSLKDRAGIAFIYKSDEAIESIKLTDLSIRASKFLASQSKDIAIRLFETESSLYTLPTAKVIALKIFSNSQIPWSPGGGLMLWADFDMGDDFILDANRYYFLKLKSAEAGEACAVRLRESTESSPPDNDIRGFYRYKSQDWKPLINDQHKWDIPFKADFEVTKKNQLGVSVPCRVEFTISLEHMGEIVTVTGCEHLEGVVK